MSYPATSRGSPASEKEFASEILRLSATDREDVVEEKRLGVEKKHGHSLEQLPIPLVPALDANEPTARAIYVESDIENLTVSRTDTPHDSPGNTIYLKMDCHCSVSRRNLFLGIALLVFVAAFVSGVWALVSNARAHLYPDSPTPPFPDSTNSTDQTTAAPFVMKFNTAIELKAAVNLYLECFTSSGCGTELRENIIQWDVSAISDFSNLFSNALDFNAPLSNWDISSATNMSRMFFRATQFNGDVSTWNVSQVVDMSHMFQSAESFAGDLSAWNPINVRNTSHMFAEAVSFNSDISSWTMEQLDDMSYMFFGAIGFDQDLCRWDSYLPGATNVTKSFEATSCESMESPDLASSAKGPFCHRCNDELAPQEPPDGTAFSDASTLKNAVQTCMSESPPCTDINSWDVSMIDDFSELFSSDRVPNVIVFSESLDQWNVSSARNMNRMFYGATSFNGDVSSWDVSNVVDMSSMFEDAAAFAGDLSTWNPGSVRTTNSMFASATAFNCDVSGWKTKKLQDMSFMFSNALSFNQSLCEWLDFIDASTQVDGAFEGTSCPSQEAPDVGGILSPVFCTSCGIVESLPVSGEPRK